MRLNDEFKAKITLFGSIVGGFAIVCSYIVRLNDKLKLAKIALCKTRMSVF